MLAEQTFCIVVTHNRCAMLLDCLAAISGQSVTPARIIIVDNASEDDTYAVLERCGWLDRPDVDYVRLSRNEGGAGGFAAGVERAACAGPAWLWLMDDDAVPHRDALERLQQVATDPAHVYGSLAVTGRETAWPVMVKGMGVRATRIKDVPEFASVSSIPFLGFMIHTNLVQQIGLPDAGYFIAADDIEYCRRAEAHGAQLIIASQSRIEHPQARFREIGIFGTRWIYFYLPPWKRYYDTRNRLFLAKRHYQTGYYLKTIPGSLGRLVAAWCFESDRMAQSKALICGILDGVRGVSGCRHEKWGIGR